MPAQASIYRFGPYELRPRTRELYKQGIKLKLRPQPFQILNVLVEHAGDVVTREELRELLWPVGTFVDFEHGLNASIKELRGILSDSASEPRYIETLPRLGYRIMVPVDVSEPPSSAEAAPPAQSAAAENLIGKKVSHYRVLQLLGGGGMGVVYKAEDLKLGRLVALKFLPGELASDPVAFERLQLEARAASALDHPNICSIYELGEHEGQPFIVMQLLQGQTLREWIESAAKESTNERLNQLLDLAIQIADGLEAAHQKGIIHRDIKPANIFVTGKDQAKILDFGVAKFVDIVSEFPQGAAADDNAEDSTQVKRIIAFPDTNLTKTGLSMGTPSYLSPEQVRRERLDARTDVFSFGVVLYEMATGQQAFSGNTVAVIREAVLRQPAVAVRQLKPELPPELEGIIAKALEKDPDLRYQSAADLRTDLKRVKRDTDSTRHIPPLSSKHELGTKPKGSRRLVVLGAAIAIVLLVIGFGMRQFNPHWLASRTSISERQLTHNPPENRVLGLAISPDGKHLAYADTTGLHLRGVDTGETHDLPLPGELRTHLWNIAWFPDGEKLVLQVDSEAEGQVLWLTSIFGGAPRKLHTHGQAAAVAPDGSAIAFISQYSHEIWVMGPGGEDPHKVLGKENEEHVSLAWSPTGRRIAYIRPAKNGNGGNIETWSLDGGSVSTVTSDPLLETYEQPPLLWLRDGRLIFERLERLKDGQREGLWSITTDSSSGKPRGQAANITNWDATIVNWIVSASGNGNRMVVNKMHNRDDIYVADLQQSGTRLNSPQRLTVSDSLDYPTAWTHDSTSVIFQSNRAGRNQIFRQPLSSDTAELLVQGADDEVGAEPTPDGAWILYWANSNPGREPSSTAIRLMRFPAAGGSPTQVLEVPNWANSIEPNNVEFDCPSSPGKSCVLARSEQEQLLFFALDPVRGQGREIGRTKVGSSLQTYWSLSPDGAVIGVANPVRLPEKIRILDLHSAAERDIQLPHGWRIWSLCWAADGKGLFATVSQSGSYLLVRVDLDGQTHVLLDRGRSNWISFVTTSPDGRHLAFCQQIFESNAWLWEGF